MDTRVLDWFRELLKQEGYVVFHQSKIKTLRATATVDRALLADCEDRWELRRRVDNIVMQRIAEAVAKAPWCCRREQEALTDMTSTRFAIELVVVEEECKILTTTE